jgi:hypothetical protein
MRVKETIEEAAERIYPVNIVSDGYDTNMLCRIGFYIGYELSQERVCDDEIINLIRYSLSNAEARRIIKKQFKKYRK